MLGRRVGTFLVNIMALVLSFLITYVLRFGWEPNEAAFNNINDAIVLESLILSYLVVFLFYRPKKNVGRGLFNLLKDSFLSVLFMAVVFSTLVYTSHISDSIPRMFFGYFFVTDFVLTFVCGATLHILQKCLVKTHLRKTVVFTDIADKDAVVRRLLKQGRDDMEIVGVVTLNQDGKGVYYGVETKVVGGDTALLKAGLVKVDPLALRFLFTKEKADAMTYLKQHQIDQMIMCVERLDRDKMREVIDAVGEMGIDSMITMDTLAVDNFESKMEDFGTMQVIRLAPRIFTEGELFVKRVLDIIGSIVGCLICIVVGIFVVPAIYICDPGPVIFKQKRVGRNGKYFEIYKFRSMYKDAEKRRKKLKETQNEMGDSKMFKMKDDPRITKVGKFIRKTSIDELPQFFNVLKGDMSLVGTRPPMIDEYEEYSQHHKRRLTLKPGITGLWQVSGRSEITDFEDIVRLDCYYIDHWSVLYDLKILLMTVGAVVTGRGSE